MELHDIFEAENVWEGGKTGSWRLKQSAFIAGWLMGFNNNKRRAT